MVRASGRTSQTIALESDDDIPIIRDRLEWADADAEHVFLVAPARSPTLRNLVNLKLVARHARNTGHTVALITGDPYVADLCREASLTTYRSLRRAQAALSPPGVGTLRGEQGARSRKQGARSNEREARSEKRGVRRPTHYSLLSPLYFLLPTPYSLPWRARRPGWLPPFQLKTTRPLTGVVARRLVRAFGFLILLAFLAASIGVVLLLLVPEGRIGLRARRAPVQASFVMRANPKVEKVDYAVLDIPARLAQVELRDTGRIAPTGASDMPTERASGSVTFINRTAQEATVPISTTISTSSGTTVGFLTNVTATVPALLNASVVVTVTALVPGPIGNVAAAQINRIDSSVLARQLAVINETPTRGGAVATAGVVTRADKDRLWSTVLQQMSQEGHRRLTAELGEQEIIPPESVVVLPLDGAFTPSLDGEQTDQLSLDMRAVVRGTVVGGQYANQLALAALQAEMPAGHRLDPRSLKFVMGRVIGVNEEQAVSFDMQASGEAVAQFAADQVMSEVVGLPVEQAQRLLSHQLPLAEAPRVTVEPDWLGRLPLLPFRITVTVSE